MSCKPTNLNFLAHANGFTLWHYNAGDDNYTEIMFPTDYSNYFIPASDMLRAGDMIMVNYGANKYAMIVVVTYVSTNAVCITNLIPNQNP